VNHLILIVKNTVHDAHYDHLFVLNECINRRGHQRTPYLFSVLTVNNHKLFVVQADLIDLKDHDDIFRETPKFTLEANKRYSIKILIRLNPCLKKSRLVDGEKVDRLIPIKDNDKIKIWFKQKLQSINVNASEFVIAQKDVVSCSKGHTVINEVFAFATIDSDKESTLEQFIEKGIGKRKGYGFGLPIFENTKAFELFKKSLTNPFY